MGSFTQETLQSVVKEKKVKTYFNTQMSTDLNQMDTLPNSSEVRAKQLSFWVQHVEEEWSLLLISPCLTSLKCEQKKSLFGPSMWKRNGPYCEFQR